MSETIATREQVEALTLHHPAVEEAYRGIVSELLDGSISGSLYYKTPEEIAALYEEEAAMAARSIPEYTEFLAQSNPDSKVVAEMEVRDVERVKKMSDFMMTNMHKEIVQKEMNVKRAIHWVTSGLTLIDGRLHTRIALRMGGEASIFDHSSHPADAIGTYDEAVGEELAGGYEACYRLGLLLTREHVELIVNSQERPVPEIRYNIDTKTNERNKTIGLRVREESDNV